MKRILVTGGCGFIGSHLVDALVGAGQKVVIIDNLSTGNKAFVNKKARLVVGDITNEVALNQLIIKHGPFGIIFHLAAQKSVTASARDPHTDAKINIMGSLNLFEAARKHNIKRIIFSSTGGALYGDGVTLPTKEDAKIEPLSPYGIAKYSIENYLRFYQQLGISTQILRYSNVYGPRQDPHGEAGVVAIFCQKVLKGEDLTIFGDGKQTRDFVYVGDVVAANLAAIKSKTSSTWNIGTGKETSINQLTKGLVAIAQDIRPKINYAPARLGELKRSCLDNSKAKKELKWQPQTTLADGLKLTLENFMNQKQKEI